MKTRSRTTANAVAAAISIVVNFGLLVLVALYWGDRPLKLEGVAGAVFVAVVGMHWLYEVLFALFYDDPDLLERDK